MRIDDRKEGKAMIEALKQHWPEYLIEGMGLGVFMVSACGFGVLLEHPATAVHRALPDPVMRRVLMGAAMGLTAMLIIYSPWGKRSGAHINPAVTLTFWGLGKIEKADAFYYIFSQFVGAIGGVWIAGLFLRDRLADGALNYAVTLPGNAGTRVAFAAEAIISFILMMTVLTISNRVEIARYTGLLAGCLVAFFIAFEAPLSGMSMNPARSFGSAFVAGTWPSIWIYFTAPPLGMLSAAAIYRRLTGVSGILCAKLHHLNQERCIFKCKFGEAVNPASARWPVSKEPHARGTFVNQ